MDGKVSQLLKMVLRFLIPQLDVDQIPTVAKKKSNTENVYKKSNQNTNRRYYRSSAGEYSDIRLGHGAYIKR